MKKILAMAALAVAAVSANAAGLTGFATYDYDRANAGQGSWKSQHEVKTGVALGTQFGTVDAAVVGRQLVTNVRDDNLGFEVGYSNGLKLGTVSLTGRAAYGQINNVDLRTAQFSGNSSYYSLEAVGSMPVTDTLSVFAGFRHRNGLNVATPAYSNRTTVGVDYALNKSVVLHAGYAFTKQADVNYNGLTTAVSYKF